MLMRGVLLSLVAIAGLAGCGNAPEPRVDPAAAAAFDVAFAQAEMSPQVQDKWARSCALCHVAGEGGAPRMGDPDAWSARRDAGDAVLLAHTIEGYRRMPPLGYCMDCELADFAAMIRMMSNP